MNSIKSDCGRIPISSLITDTEEDLKEENQFTTSEKEKIHSISKQTFKKSVETAAYPSMEHPYNTTDKDTIAPILNVNDVVQVPMQINVNIIHNENKEEDKIDQIFSKNSFIQLKKELFKINPRDEITVQASRKGHAINDFITFKIANDEIRNKIYYQSNFYQLSLEVQLKKDGCGGWKKSKEQAPIITISTLEIGGFFEGKIRVFDEGTVKGYRLNSEARFVFKVNNVTVASPSLKIVSKNYYKETSKEEKDEHPRKKKKNIENETKVSAKIFFYMHQNSFDLKNKK